MSTSPESFIRLVAESMEKKHYDSIPCEYVTEAYISESFRNCDRIDEGFVDMVKMLGRAVAYPIEKVKNFWKHDRELVDEVSKAEKAIPRETIAAIYSADFADTNIVQDVWDMLCMLKDVILFRYKHIPWRTAISAAGLALYYFSPWNITLGTALVKWLESNGAASFTGSLFVGGGNADVGADSVVATPSGTSADLKPDPSWTDAGDGMYKGQVAPDGHEPIYANDNGKWIDINQPATSGTVGSNPVEPTTDGITHGSGSVQTGEQQLPTSNPDVNVNNDGSTSVYGNNYTASADNIGPEVGAEYTLDNGVKAKCLEVTSMQHPSNPDITYEVSGFDMNGDGKVDVWIRPGQDQIARDAATNESITAIATAGAAAVGAGVLFYKANKAQIISGLKIAEPYLNHLDELLIVFILWKWFKKDLKDYRKWLATKSIVQDRRERGIRTM